MASARPIIAVSGPDRGGFVAWCMTALAVWRNGGRPLRVTPSRPIDESRLDGVIIGGGTDVDPLHYGEDREPPHDPAEDEHSTLLDWLVGIALAMVRLLFARHVRQGYDTERDQMETRLIKLALQRDLPVLGICRGAQLMNVVLGGTLHRDIGHFYTEGTSNIRSILPAKDVVLEEGSRLRGILGVPHCRVNALHDQSIKTLGGELAVSAVEHSGVIQAIEKQGQAFFIGVQWHPEYLPQSTMQQDLFRALVERALDSPPAGAEIR